MREKVDKIVALLKYDKALKKLEHDHRLSALRKVKKIVGQLARFEIKQQSRNHKLNSAKGVNDIHIEDDLILLYRYDGDILFVELKLFDIVNHKQLQNAISKIKESSNMSKNVDIESAYIPEGPIDPPEDNRFNYLPEYEAVVEMPLDAIIFVDDDGNWDYEDEDYPWAKGDSKNGDWYDEENNIYLGDKVDMVEKTDDLLFKYIPARVGTYHISGNVKLLFDISGVEEKVTDAWYDEDHGYDYDSEINTDFADVDYIEEKSEIQNFKMQPVDE